MNKTEKKEIYNSFQRLKTLSTKTRTFDFEKAKYLTFFKKDDKYKQLLGDDEATWKKFLEQPEIGQITYVTAYRLITIYSKYIEELSLRREDIEGIDTLVLSRLTSHVNKENVKSWLERAKHMKRAEVFREMKYGRVDPDLCRHDWKKKEVKTCRICGKKEVKIK